jgi:ParB/RepB/Spo0J family partition protein
MQQEFLKYDELAPSEDFENPREKFDQVKLKQLAANIKEEGLYYSLLVWETEKDGKKINVVLDGERRRRAIAMLIDDGDETFKKGIPVKIVQAANLKEARYKALNGNIQREELTSFEVSQEMHRLKLMGENQKTISSRLSKSETWVSRKLNAYENASKELRKAWRSQALPDDTVESIATLRCANAEKDEHDDDCEDCEGVQDEAVDVQLKLREKGDRKSKSKARRTAKRKKNKVTVISKTEILALLEFASHAKKDDRYSTGVKHTLEVILGKREDEKFDTEFRQLRKGVEKEMEEAAEAAAKDAEKWAKGDKNGAKHASA